MDNENNINRKQFLAKIIKGAGLTTIGGITWGSFVHELKAAPFVLRPPGALPEEDFQKQCIKCGMCVEACPYDALELATAGSNKPMGMPYFTPRKIPCYLCEDIPCVEACPSDSLEEKLVTKEEDGKLVWDINKSRMGIAVVDQENCIAYWGIQCDACYRACPILDKAITLEYKRNERTGKHAMLMPEIHNDFCTGCGLCEHACVTEKASVYVLPREIALGKVGTNYVKGWEERDEERLLDSKNDVQTETERSKEDVEDYLNNEIEWDD
ncbi:MAG: ferredoxin-type protein NapG [Calditrichaeota bacterium]|nr:MAG: ferredoxin-type protein NapG [Calditrichota bacterium]MBL1205089.1 ferredoxin-type protein NapG [Calditrichota bacterium]NOG44919.1 ferredoxin-type protein NapG [Calditrichota bacterium]